MGLGGVELPTSRLSESPDWLGPDSSSLVSCDLATGYDTGANHDKTGPH
jgi:hypothetical protein